MQFHRGSGYRLRKLKTSISDAPVTKLCMPKQLSLLGGQAKSIPAYYVGQNANGVPDHFETVDDANRMKSSGRARSIHRGTALLIKGPRRISSSTRDSVKLGWRVVGQTGRGKTQNGPGCPRWGSVGKRTR